MRLTIILLFCASVAPASLTTATLLGDQGQAHYWTGVADRPNSFAGTEGMTRSLHEYFDAWGPNELVAPISVIYAEPICESCVVPLLVPPSVIEPPVTPDAPVAEPGAFVLSALGMVVILTKRRCV
jgi:hypothetical protein